MAEVLARREAAARGWDGVEVRSAGAAAANGAPASEGARRAAQRHGLDLSDHVSRPLTQDEVRRADLILTMSGHHLVRVMELGGGDRATLLTAFAAGDGEERLPESVTDPIGGGDEAYEETFTLLETLVRRVFDRLQPVVTR